MSSLDKTNALNRLPARILDARRRLLRMHYESGCGHIGGNLSCLDILMTLFHTVLRPQDQFVLSKGHAAGALYTVLWTVGVLSDDDLRTFHKDDTRLGGHPSPRHVEQIPFATGSLGHGLPLACGLALGRHLSGEPGRVYCLLSDGEWQEGSNWEALIFAAQRGLPLTIIVDRNGLQGFARVRDLSGADLEEQFSAFGVATSAVPGHDERALHLSLAAPRFGTAAIIADTVKGSGVRFMEDRLEWHSLPMTQEMYEQALADLEAGGRIYTRRAA